MDEGYILPKLSAGMLQLVSPMIPHTELVWRGALSRPRRVSGCRVRGEGGQLRCSQLSRGLWDALGYLGELQAGTLHHAGLTAALVGTGHIAGTLTVQVVIPRP